MQRWSFFPILILALISTIGPSKPVFAATIGVDTIGTINYPHGGMSFISRMTGFKHEDVASCAIVTTDTTRAWVGLYTSPGEIV